MPKKEEPKVPLMTYVSPTVAAKTKAAAQKADQTVSKWVGNLVAKAVGGAK